MAKSKKMGILRALELNQSLIERMLVEPVDMNEVKDELIEFSIRSLGLSEEDGNALRRVWLNPVLRQLSSDFNYTGEWPRAFRKLGFTCESFNSAGEKQTKNTKGTKWKLTSRRQGAQEADSFPPSARAAWAKAKKCNLSDLPLEGHFELDHRRGRHHFGNLELTASSSAEEWRAATQPLSRNANTKKREVCRKCQDTKVRPNGGYDQSVPFHFEGTAEFDEAVGCNGCFWAYPEQWRAALVKVIPIKPI